MTGKQVVFTDFGIPEKSLLPCVGLLERVDGKVDEYIAPEYHHRGRKVEHKKADIWTLGRLLFELFSDSKLEVSMKLPLERDRNFLKHEVAMKLAGVQAEYVRTIIS